MLASGSGGGMGAGGAGGGGGLRSGAKMGRARICAKSEVDPVLVCASVDGILISGGSGWGGVHVTLRNCPAWSTQIQAKPPANSKIKSSRTRMGQSLMIELAE